VGEGASRYFFGTRLLGREEGCVSARVPLTQGLFALVDDSDLERVSGRKWWLTRAGRTTYALSRARGADGRWHTITMHGLITGHPFVDHRNGDGLDNRRSNLRAATRTQNTQNSRAIRGKSSRYKGVRWHTNRKWQARIRVNGKPLHLGMFATEEDAARAYDKVARESFGEYAALNFPNEGERSALEAA
jgi:hypothetical protein